MLRARESDRHARPGSRRELAILFSATLCMATPLNAMLPILPIAVREAGGQTSLAGVATGAIAVTTVALELGAPRVLGRWPSHWVLMVSFALSCASTVGLALTDGLVLLVFFGLLFGVGFGLAATVVSMVPATFGAADGRAAAFAIYGFGSAAPAVVAPPAALLALPWIHTGGVFLASGALCVAGLLSATAATARLRMRTPCMTSTAAWPAGLGRVLLGYGCVTFTYGGVVSYTAFHLGTNGLISAAGFFVVFGLVRAVSRALAAHLLAACDERLAVSVWLLVSAAGLVCLAVGTGALVVVAAVLYGIGFGSTQTTSLVTMLRPGGAATASGSAGWNLASDAGMGLGALALAPVAGAFGYGAVFAALPAFAVLGLALHWLSPPFEAGAAEPVPHSGN